MLLLVAILQTNLWLLDLVARCDCPTWLIYPGHGHLAGLSILYLGLCYVAFLVMLLAARRHSGAGSVPPFPGYRLAALARGIDQHNRLISLAIGITLLPIFAHTHPIRWANNLSIALAFALLMFHVVRWMQQRVAAGGYSLNVRGQRHYIAYALLILLLIILIPTADNRDPLGTRFQLQILCMLLALHLAYSWASDQWRMLRKLQSERAEAELALLKSQINPHFLFNTLNNLYGLAREKSERTPDLILRLSSLLRHSVYQAGKARVPLAEEVDYLKGYIELQQIRYAKQVNVTFDCRIEACSNARAESTPPAGYCIAPMLLIVLLENAYKHGVDSLAEDARIDMQLRVRAGRLAVHVHNNFAPLPSPAPRASGVGLANLRRRLELEYPDRYRWTQRSQDGQFEVDLELPLDLTSEAAGP